MEGGMEESATSCGMDNYLAHVPTHRCQPTTGDNASAIVPRSLPTRQPLLPIHLEFNHDIVMMRDEVWC